MSSGANGETNNNPSEENVAQPSEPPKPGPVPANAGANVTGVYEMLWDCPACGTKKLLGVTHKFCPNCGHPQDAKYRYFPSEEEQVAVQDHIYYGRDKICPACQAPNSGRAGFCTQCGSPLEGAREVQLRAEQVRGDGERFAGESKADAKQELEQTNVAAEAEAPKIPFWKSKLGIGLIAGGSAFIAFIITSIFWTKTVEVDVTGHSWERVIKIEDYNWRNRSDWCDSVPMDAVVTTRSREIRSYEKVADGETCVNRRIDQGDGSFRTERVCTTKYKDVPVYADKCYYRVLRWEFKRTVKAQGNNATDEPYWPTTNLRSCQIPAPGCEREGNREQTYTVHFKNAASTSTHKCNFNQEIWKSYQYNGRYTGKAGVVFNDLRCDSLKPNT